MSDLLTAALAAVHRPHEHASGELFIMCLVVLVPAVCFCAVVDFAIASRFVPGARYFALHGLCNLCNVVFNFDDTWLFVADPMRTATCVTYPCASKLPAILTAAVHIWHIVRHFSELKQIDIIHHVPALSICFLAMYYRYGASCNANNMVLMGLPGMIDYTLLVAAKQGWSSWTLEKKVNRQLNVWIRSPFSCITGFCTLSAAWTEPEAMTEWGHFLFYVVFSLHACWNGPFFLNRAVESDARHTLMLKHPALKEMVAAAKSKKEDGGGGGGSENAPSSSSVGDAHVKSRCAACGSYKEGSLSSY